MNKSKKEQFPQERGDLRAFFFLIRKYDFIDQEPEEKSLKSFKLNLEFET